MEADCEFADLYEAIYQRRLTEPTEEQHVKDVLSCINALHGSFSDDEKNQMHELPLILQRKISQITGRSLKNLAHSMKSQHYDDSFRFFYELVQNADDATYSQYAAMPTMTFTVLPEELRVDINEDGFSLADVLSICNTGQGSKRLDDESTREKGLGFKAVFGVADQVHVQSGLWSFRFEHQRRQDGMGMITPIWEPREQLPIGVGTRFRLRYSMSEDDSLDTVKHIWKMLETQHPSLLFALRKLKKISIDFKGIEGRNHTVCLKKLSPPNRSIVRIAYFAADKCTFLHYRTFATTVRYVPKHHDRPRSVSTIRIGFPLTRQSDGVLKVEEDGQFVFAGLPIMRVAQLPFLIHADFLLLGSRQTITDNAWNRKLRDEVARLFACAVEKFVRNKSQMAYEWLRFIPQPMIGFWQPLRDLIHEQLSTRNILYSRTKTLLKPSGLRILSKEFTYQAEPLLPESNQPWQFLSTRYSDSNMSTLKFLGVENMSFAEALELIKTDTLSTDSSIQKWPLDDQWHNKFLSFVHLLLSYNRDEVNLSAIVPVRVKTGLEWRRPGQDIYLPTVVDEGNGSERITIAIPTDLDVVVLHPNAAKDDSRREVYQSLGVRSCPPATIRAAIEVAQLLHEEQCGNDLHHFELLFWFSHRLSLGVRNNLIATTSAGFPAKSKELFMHSHQRYHAENLLNLAKNPQHKWHFLDASYQQSPVSTRTRGGVTWEQWLCEVAGVRWYPPLSDPKDPDKLHWTIEYIRDNNPRDFVPMIQHHWAPEYNNVCRHNGKIRQAIKECKVRCRHNGYEEISKTWFPSHLILEAARKYGVEEKIPILALPESTDNYGISNWPSLTELGVRSALDLSFYMQVLSLLSARGETLPISVAEMGGLYKSIGDRVTLEDIAYLKNEFQEKNLVWDPHSSKWRTLSECVWTSRIPLTSKFVLTSEYNESVISGLFHTHLKTADVSVDTLINELQYLKINSSGIGEKLIHRASDIYDLLSAMTVTAVDRHSLSSRFKTNDLIYKGNGNRWLKSSSCLWHATIEIGNNVPIASAYPGKKGFFVDVLGVDDVTDVFMMKQLAAAAAKSPRSADEIKRIMLSASALFHVNSDPSQFEAIVKPLQQIKYLPCKSLSGLPTFCSPDEYFFIVDNKYYAEKFNDKLILLDFTYENFILLHDLFRILRLDKHYLARHVRREVSAKTSIKDGTLTIRFRQCAYALSCCAISHRSPLFANQSKQTYEELKNVTIYTSVDMSAKLVVGRGVTAIKAECGRPSLIVKPNALGLHILLPAAQEEKNKIMRGQLPSYLSDHLQIIDCRGEKQIYRIINDLESSTDEILFDEGISRVSWLPETSRPVFVWESRIETLPQQQLQYGNTVSVVGDFSDHDRVGTLQPPKFKVATGTTHHEVEAVEYWKVLEHVRKQAAAAGSHILGTSNSTTDDVIGHLASLSLDCTDFDPAEYPILFGDELSKHRVEVAGELFACELLRWLTSNKFNLQRHWQSSLRHLVNVHQKYSCLKKWDGRESAAIVYKDENNSLGKLFQSRGIGDAFQGWRPDWLADQDSLEWLFDIKTAIGPCKMEFSMSLAQYNLMRSLGDLELDNETQQNGETREAPQRRRRDQVYCIIHVYNLLSKRIGFRFFIDPWRFRER